MRCAHVNLSNLHILMVSYKNCVDGCLALSRWMVARWCEIKSHMGWWCQKYLSSIKSLLRDGPHILISIWACFSIHIMFTTMLSIIYNMKWVWTPPLSSGYWSKNTRLPCLLERRHWTRWGTFGHFVINKYIAIENKHIEVVTKMIRLCCTEIKKKLCLSKTT